MSNLSWKQKKSFIHYSEETASFTSLNFFHSALNYRTNLQRFTITIVTRAVSQLRTSSIVITAVIEAIVNELIIVKVAAVGKPLRGSSLPSSPSFFAELAVITAAISTVVGR
jgi:hypothetical protein